MIPAFLPVLAGLILAELALIVRGICFKDRKRAFGPRYLALCLVALLGSFLGGWGLWNLTGVPVACSVNFGQILVVLALLGAAVITGFFTFTFTAGHSTDILFPTLISMLFTALFYIIFAAISFYIGKSTQTHGVTGVRYAFPLIMLLLLLTNTLFDFWDYQYVDHHV